MSRRRKWSLLAANVVVVTVIITACRSQGDSAQTAEEAATPVPESALEEVDDDSPEVEVTRIVVETEVVEVSPENSETGTIPKELVVCIGAEPLSLYPYATPRIDSATEHVLQGIYEPIYTTLSYDYQARGIEKMPSLADGDATILPVAVSEGDRVVNTSGDVVVLRPGIRVQDVDGNSVEFDGSPVTMQQLTVSFSLKPLVWSDGTPVTADDSVYSFELASDPQTPVPKSFFERTQSYEATGERTVEWRGIPGYLDQDYFANIMTPYPRHYWDRYTAAELLTAEEAVRKPLSYGPYVINEWIPEDHILLDTNPHYYRGTENLPRIDRIRFNFVPSSSQLIGQLLAGECDIGTSDGLNTEEANRLIDAENGGLLRPYFQEGTVFEHIDFGINPVEEYANTRPDWFEDYRVRQAIVMCTDRQRMVDELLYGRGEVLNAYIPSVHPLYPDDLHIWPYDISAANALLDEAGFPFVEESGIREDPLSGSPFRITLLGVTGNELLEQVSNRLQEDLAQCGIEVMIELINADQYFADGPEGPLFGRRFDLAAFPWLIGIEPNCGLYLSSRVPSKANNWNLNYNNETGFTDKAFDEACLQALASLPGTESFVDSHQNALRRWTEQLPIIPLFTRIKVAATRPGIENFSLDPTQPSELWNLGELDMVGE